MDTFDALIEARYTREIDGEVKDYIMTYVLTHLSMNALEELQTRTEHALLKIIEYTQNEQFYARFKMLDTNEVSEWVLYAPKEISL